MGFLDDIYFYILDKILRISLRFCGWFDDVLGLDDKGSDQAASTQPEGSEGGKNGD